MASEKTVLRLSMNLHSTYTVYVPILAISFVFFYVLARECDAIFGNDSIGADAPTVATNNLFESNFNKIYVNCCGLPTAAVATTMHFSTY